MERQRFCRLEVMHWTGIGEKPNKVPTLVLEFSADCAEISAKSEVIGFSITVDYRENGFYSSYTPI